MPIWILATLLISLPAVAQLTPGGRPHAAGARVDLPEVGVTFQVPPGWTAAPQEQPGAVMLASADGKTIGFLFVKAGVSESEMKGFFTEKTDGILRLEQTTVAGFPRAWSFDFRDADLGLLGTGRAVLAPSSTAALVLLLSQTSPPASLTVPIETWIRALRFTAGENPGVPAPALPAPTPPSASNPFRGRQIHAFKSYSGGDYFSSTKMNLDLCSDGTYVAVITKESSSVSGILPPSRNTEREAGTWSFSGAAPNWTLTLRGSDGVSNNIPVVRSNSGMRFGDMPAELLAANCR